MAARIFFLGLFCFGFFGTGCLTLSPDQKESKEDNTAEEGFATGARMDKEKEKENEPGFFGRLFGGKKDKDDDKAKKPSHAIPKEIPVGSIHLVHPGGFVLIKGARGNRIPREALLMTYRAGRPTGKLRISPEKKGAFLVADIVQGHPSPGDVVSMSAMVGPDGRLIHGPQSSDGPEILE